MMTYSRSMWRLCRPCSVLEDRARHWFAVSMWGAVALGVVVGLASCTTTPAVGNDIAAVEIALTAAERAALIYTSLPRCGGVATLCSSQATVDRVKAADQQAYQAMKAAQKDSGLISAAWGAISAFQLATPVK